MLHLASSGVKPHSSSISCSPSPATRWNIFFDKAIKIYDFVRNGKEPYVYKSANDSVVIFFILYVDDILLIRNDIPALPKSKAIAVVIVLHKGFRRSILHFRDEDL